MAIIKSNRPKPKPRRRNGKASRASRSYQYHSGLQPWMHNPNGPEADEDDLTLGFETEDVLTQETQDIVQTQEERLDRAIATEAERQVRQTAVADIVRKVTTADELSFWTGRGFRKKERNVTPRKAKENLNSFIETLAQNPQIRMKWQDWCKVATTGKKSGFGKANWARLKALATFVIKSYLPLNQFRREITPDKAFLYLVCGGQYEEWYVAARMGDKYGQWSLVDRWIDYVRTGKPIDMALPQTEEHETALVPHGSLREAVQQGIVGGTIDPGALSKEVSKLTPTPEYGEDDDEEWDELDEDREPLLIREADHLLEIEAGAHAGARSKQARDWSNAFSRSQQERFDRRGPRFDRDLFAPFVEFLEMKRRTTPVPPVKAFVDAPGRDGKPSPLDTPYSLAKGSIILVVRWNGNTQVIIPSNSTSTVLTRRGKKFGEHYAEGEPTWFPIAEFMSRPDLADEAERFGGDITSLGQAYQFTFQWRKHVEGQDKYLKYPVHIYNEMSDDPTVGPRGYEGTWDDMAAQEAIKLLYAGTRRPPSIGRFRMKKKGLPEAERILSGAADPQMASDPYQGMKIMEGEFESFNNPYRRRRRLLPNHRSRIRRKY